MLKVKFDSSPSADYVILVSFDNGQYWNGYTEKQFIDLYNEETEIFLDSESRELLFYWKNIYNKYIIYKTLSSKLC